MAITMAGKTNVLKKVGEKKYLRVQGSTATEVRRLDLATTYDDQQDAFNKLDELRDSKMLYWLYQVAEVDKKS